MRGERSNVPRVSAVLYGAEYLGKLRLIRTKAVDFCLMEGSNNDSEI